jgi:Lon protease-like protein
MQQELLPLFPLQLVLLPNAQLSLHIFEERYKEMIGEAIQRKSEFGIVLASEKGIVNTGCTARVERVVKRYDDGRMDIVAVGLRRFEILLLNEEKDYLRGAVEYFDDEDTRPASADATAKVQAVFEQIKQLESSGEEEGAGPETPFSFQVARAVPDLNLRQVLLATRSEAERIQRLAEHLPGVLEKMRTVAHVRAVAPSNGHARHAGF